MGAAPTLAGDISGFYGGIYAAPSIRSGSDFDLGAALGAFDGPGVVAVPSSIVSNGMSPPLLDLANDGLSHFPNADLGIVYGISGSGDVDFSPTLGLGAVFGYGFGNGVRIDADVSAAVFEANKLTLDSFVAERFDGAMDEGAGTWTWHPVGVDSFPGGGTTLFSNVGLSLQTSTQFLLANVWYDIPTGTAFSPYLGGGIGLAHVTSTFTVNHTATNASEIVPAAELGAGLRYAVNDKVNLDLGYRYKLAFNSALRNRDVEDLGPPAFAGFESIQRGPIAVQSIQAGVTFALD